MVAQCIADTNLAAWVRRTLRDEVAVKGFIADVKRNPKVIDGIPSVGSLRTKLTALGGQKRGLVLQVAAKAWRYTVRIRDRSTGCDCSNLIKRTRRIRAA